MRSLRPTWGHVDKVGSELGQVRAMLPECGSSSIKLANFPKFGSQSSTPGRSWSMLGRSREIWGELHRISPQVGGFEVPGHSNLRSNFELLDPNSQLLAGEHSPSAPPRCEKKRKTIPAGHVPPASAWNFGPLRGVGQTGLEAEGRIARAYAGPESASQSSESDGIRCDRRRCLWRSRRCCPRSVCLIRPGLRRQAPPQHASGCADSHQNSDSARFVATWILGDP